MFSQQISALISYKKLAKKNIYGDEWNVQAEVFWNVW